MARLSGRKAQAINEHVYKLEAIFPHHTAGTSGRLWDKLHRLEAEAHSAAERYSSYPTPEGWIERKEKSILRRLDQLLRFREAGVPVFVNLDPRGAALKIDEHYVRERGLDIHQDWGNYGILVPKF